MSYNTCLCQMRRPSAFFRQSSSVSWLVSLFGAGRMLNSVHSAGLFAWLLLKEPYTRLEAIVGCTSLLGTVFIAKPSFLFPPPPRNPEDPLDTVTPEQRTSAVLVALIGVLGAAGAYLIIRLIGKRATATHSILYFSTYSVRRFATFISSPRQS